MDLLSVIIASVAATYWMLAMWQESLEVLFIHENIYLCSNLMSFTKVLSSLSSKASFITRR